MQRKEIYQASLDTWGEDAQYDQAVEECAELIVALKHFRRGRIAKQAVVDELADVTLIIGQLTWMFGPAEVDAAIKQKLAKLDLLLTTSE
jgi:NTP pyrophosphatase (non-canonical NTP hydrolase)